jgi:hypothetical protein
MPSTAKTSDPISSPITISDYGTEIRWIGQDLIPLQTPLGVPIVNPFSQKQMQFFKQYKVTGVTLEEARNGVLFGSYRPFMEIPEETYSRKRHTRHLTFNPFFKEMSKYGEYAGSIGVRSGQTVASMMVMMLGMITWDITEEPQTNPKTISFRYKTTNRMFGGHFRIRVHELPDGVVLEDDWTTAGGNTMLTSFLPMSNLVLFTHPKGFHQIATNFVDEVKRARAARQPYKGEIGSPSIELRD